MRTSNRRLFTTVRTEGALLPADLLGRIVEGDTALPGLTPEDYHLLPGERINEATNRAWNRAVGAWTAFQSTRTRGFSTAFGTSETRDRWLLPLFQGLDYGRLTRTQANEAPGKSYPISHVWGRVPIHLIGAGIDLDKRTATVAGAARTNPHGMVQEALINTDAFLWGFVSNGLRLRLLRDSMRLSRPAFVEFDLEAMMKGEIYADFVLFWLLCHESRVEAERPEDCWLEKWAQVAREQGTRVRENLRGGVQQAIETLGRGFLAHPANGMLREHLRTGELETQEYFHQLLLLIYRLLFLFVAEDRAVLLDPSATREAKRRYMDFYSTQRLRYLASRRRGGRHTDLYTLLRLVLTALGDDHGQPGLALPSLGSMLFAAGADSATPSLDVCSLANQDLLEAIRALAFVVDQSVRRPVDFRNLGTEELGSVYEALLELHPTLSMASDQFVLESVRGSERKTTGSYYTPESLAAELVKSAVEPVLDAAVARGGNAERAILNLKICDPAAGSGHLLLTAARMLAKRLAQARTGDAEPAPAALRTALRDVISRCIYAVDVNPMAVELCKVSLWMEAVEPGKPLSFLDHHIKCGNSLIGATRELLGAGVPDDAFDPVTGDDRAVAREIKRRNRREREGQLKLPFPADAPLLGNLAEDFRRLTAMPEVTPEQIHAKQHEYERLHAQTGYDNGRLYADTWCAAFFWPLDDGHQGDAPTEGELRKLEQSPWSASIFLKQEVHRLATEQRFFHWHLEFPNVFDGSSGEGFDCVLGNSPWEQVELKEEEFFAVRAPDVVAGGTGAERKRRIGALADIDPALYQLFVQERFAYDRQRKFLQNSGHFPLTGRGRTNSYSVFAECGTDLLEPRGRMGMILPWGLAVDDTNRLFFSSMVEQRRLVSAYLYANERKLFADTHHFFRFALFTFGGVAADSANSDFATHLWRVEEAADLARHFTLTPSDFALINPNTSTLPIFRTRRDADLTRQMYRTAPVLVDESGAEPISPWGTTFRQGLFNMTSDSGLFRTRAQLEELGFALAGNGVFRLKGEDNYVPLYEAKLFHQFDHRFATFEGGAGGDKTRDTTEVEHGNSRYVPLPRYWVPSAEVERALGEWRAPWLLAFRDITNATNERTFIAACLPQVGVGHTAPLLLSMAGTQGHLHLMANLNSLPFDFVARQKVGGTHMTFFIVKQFPVVPPETYERRINGERLAEWVTRRALELTYTSDDMAPLARDLGYQGPPFKWDEDRRADLRGELDGLYAHLYGLSREDFAYILTTFPVLRKNDERRYGEYRTARLALAAYDVLAPGMAGVPTGAG